MALNKRKRFAILNRDKFTCRYCGRRSVRQLSEKDFRKATAEVDPDARIEMTLRQIGWKPDLVLEVDHVVPRSEGGTDDESNLVTTCRDCNRGKGRNPLDPN